MKIFSSQHDFDYDSNEVSKANWLKYSPWNKESTHVVAVDTLSRSVNPRSGVLRSERLITCRQPAPKWLRPFLGGAEVSYIYEISHITPPATSAKSQTSVEPTSSFRTTEPSPDRTPPAARALSSLPSIRMVSDNLTWSDILRVHEVVTYNPSPEDPHRKTRFEQHATITSLCGGWDKIRNKIEEFTIDRFEQNAARGRQGFEMVLEQGRKVWDEEKRNSAKADSSHESLSKPQLDASITRPGLLGKTGRSDKDPTNKVPSL
ncbi:MAG: hypothetical protein M1831_006649 [Alyxoria varia]|nr:MAG: hypothetical protein M1831_006649 [Alyxoria varia]